MFNEMVGRRIQLKRTLKGIKQKDLAEILGVSAQAVSKWERGENSPDIALLPLLASILDSTIDWLLGNELEEFMKKTYLFSGFTDNEIRLFLPNFEKTSFFAGDYAYKANTAPDDGFYIIKEGCVSVYKGNKKMISLEKGNYFSDYSSLDDKECLTSALIETDSVIYKTTNLKIGQFVNDYPSVGVKLYFNALRCTVGHLRCLQ